MGYGEITVERNTPALRDQLIGIVRSRREQSERFGATHRQALPRLYDLWRGVYEGTFKSTRNDVHIPLIFSTCWSDVARKIATSFSMWPVLSFVGSGPDDAPTARKNEALVSAQFKDADAVDKEIVTFLGADLYGVAVSMLMWDHKEEVQTGSTWKAMPISGERVRQIQRQRVVTFDGPNYRNIDLLDFYPQPNFRRIKDMRWVCVRYYLDLDECEFLASEQGGKVFDMGEIQRLKFDSAHNFRKDEAMTRRFQARTGWTDQDRMGDPYSKPVEIIEMWGEIPREFAFLFGGSTNVVLSVANENYLFRGADNPFHHRLKPFLSYSPTPDLHYFYAPGKAEVAASLQVTGNRFVNHMLDSGDLQVHPMWVYDRNKGINVRNLFAGPGRTFGVNGDPSTALSPVPMDMRGIQVGGQMVAMMREFLQMGTGIQEDTVMGMDTGGSDRQTAREFMGRREASGTRLMLESVLYEQNYLEPMGNFFCSMNQQLLEVPRELLILGDSANEDPVTGQPIQVSRETIEGWDLMRGYSARAYGSTMAISKMAKQQNDLTVFQIVAGAQPMIAGAFNMVNFLRQMLRNLDYKNVNELIQKVPSVQEMMAQSGGGSAADMPEDMQGLAGMAGATTGPMTSGGLG